MPNTLNEIVLADYIPGPQQGQWTYRYYAALPHTGRRYEIIDGVLYMTSPSPDELHQRASIRIAYYLFSYIELTGKGHIYTAPFDVELSLNVVVQPDILAVLNENQDNIIDTHIVGAPDLIVEIVSRTSASYDRSIKYATYARTGVKEYWIADPYQHQVEVLTLEKATYFSIGIFRGQETIRSRIVPYLPIQIGALFA
jgi:Uma2 family endonuclease